MEKILKSGEKIEIIIKKSKGYYFTYIKEYPNINFSPVKDKKNIGEHEIRILEKYKNGNFRVKQGCIMEGKIFNGELLRNGRIFNNDSIGQSFDFNDCILLD